MVKINDKEVDLKMLREKLDLTQLELCVKLDISLNTLRRIENKGLKPSLKVKRKIGKYFNL
jgi:DNA-binding XRE family transcriptional regulator